MSNDKKALKLALEALEICKPEHPNHTPSRRIYNAAITALREALAEQPTQQEFAYKVTIVDDQHPNGVPLEQWGKPAQRTWVGLTECEKSYALQDKDGITLDYEDYADAIEAKLKEKNGGHNAP
jgi:predicted nucleic acid-binding protein